MSASASSVAYQPGGGSGPVLVADAISKSFGQTAALREVSLEVGADELLVVVGPTGAGKTTLLRVLCGLETADSGQVRIAGRDATLAPPAERDLAMVFQNFSLYPRWSVRRNLEFPLMAPGREVPDAERKSRVEWAAELLSLTRLLDRPAPQLSGGEMQRVAIGRAIVRQPKAYLMDEPLTNLDAKLREALRTELVELRRRVQRPMVYVTHDPAEALAMGDRVVVLAEGRVLQTGSARDVYERPAAPTVARQLGQPKVNVVPVRRGPSGWVAGHDTPIEPLEGAWVTPAGEVTATEALAGIRPEHLEIEPVSDSEVAAASGGPGGDGSLAARVHLVEYMGAASTVILDWLGTQVRCATDGLANLSVGQPVRVRVRRALLWPLQSG